MRPRHYGQVRTAKKKEKKSVKRLKNNYEKCEWKESKTGENNAILTGLYPLPPNFVPKEVFLACLHHGSIEASMATFSRR